MAWRSTVVHHLNALRFSREWTLKTPDAQETMDVVLEACLVLYGADSHWIEEREARDDTLHLINMR